MEKIKIWDSIWENIEEKDIKGWREMSKLILPTVEKEMGEVKDKYILEAGCGSSLVSLALAKKESKIFLLDNSLPALHLVEVLKKRMKVDAIPICGSILEMPFKKNSFNIVWNAGVLEHFSVIEQEQVIQGMCRTCNSKGKIIVAVPYALAFFYRLGKYFAEKNRSWEYGYERPMRTLKPLFKKNKAIVLRERDVAFEINAEYVMLLPLNTYLKILFKKIIVKGKRLLKYIFRGYLLITTAINP